MPSKIEETCEFKPVFDEKGLISCIVSDAATGAVLMMAWMNKEALDLTLSTGEAHYWSRSRQKLWRKGETSGAVQKLVELLVDCDQDCLLMRVEVQGNVNDTCHTGRESCFYRKVAKDAGGKVVLKF